ncbi:15032_t:CDS:2, partial [Racocetra fulgida]
MPAATNAPTKIMEPITPPTIAPVLGGDDGDIDDVGVGEVGKVPVGLFPPDLFGP